jgi:amino acid adenylation domain-containing protein
MSGARCPTPESFVPFRRDEIDQSIPERFRARVALAPGDIAVRTSTCEFSYARLDCWSDAIAAELFGRLGVRQEPVPFLLGQGPLAMATTLGILKAGKHYVPVDPSWGLERAADLMQALDARVMVTDAEFAAPLRHRFRKTRIVEVPGDCPEVLGPPIQVDIAPDQPAYVYFTSGSTGRPKGVVDCHRNVLHNVMRYTNALSIARTDRLSLLQSCGFSGAVSSMFAALLNGAVSCPVDMRAETPTTLAGWLDALSITIYHSVPSLFRSVMSTGRVFRNVRVVRLEGDRATRLDLELFRAHFTPPSVLANGLGATETGLVSQYFFGHGCAMPEAAVPVGYPVQDMQFEVRGEDDRPAPAGTAGEIVVKSCFLATGYWNDAPATSRAFTAVEAGSPERIYRTGDRGRVIDGGCLEHLGRLDGRARIRGQWVDLADLDVALCTLPGVREAAAKVIGEESGNPRLVAYYVGDGAPALSVSELRRQLADRLDAHVLPARFIELERLPLTANGKIDRAALPAPEPVRPNLASRMVEPFGLTQLRLCELWEEFLDVAPVGVHDDFFDLGGDSLLAMSMMSRVEEIFGRSVPVSVLLGAANIERLASALSADSRDLEGPVVPIRQEGDRPAFFFLHGDYLSGGLYCRELVRRLNPHQPFLALPPCGVDGTPVPWSYGAMAKRHLEAIRAIQPRGPYVLGGECNGALVAYEIARLLEADGERVALLALLSASAENVRCARAPWLLRAAGGALRLPPATQRYVLRRFRDFAAHHDTGSIRPLLTGLLRKRTVIAAEIGRLAGMSDSPELRDLDPGARRPGGYRERIREIYQQIDSAYLPGRFGGRVTLIWGREESPDALTQRDWWRTVAADVEVFTVPGNMQTKLTRHVGALAEVLDRLLERTLNESLVRDGTGARADVAGQRRG